MRSVAIIVWVVIVRSLEEERQRVLEIFLDRLHVAQCRANCDLQYQDDLSSANRGQCWTVCHVLASDPPLWARICEDKASVVCGPGCQTACSLNNTSELEIVETEVSASESGGLIRLTSAEEAEERGAGVNILVARGKDGAWYELVQTAECEMESVRGPGETWVIRVSAAGEASISRVERGEEREQAHWELFLDKMERDGGIFQVEVFWREDTRGERVTVTWSLDTVRGAMETRNTRVRLPVPPGARVTIQVRNEESGAVSDSLTLETPGADPVDSEERVLETSGNTLIMATSVTLLLVLAAILCLVISLYKRTRILCSSQSSSLASVTSTHSLALEKNKSIISFDTFVSRNKISVPELVSTKAKF